jgi:hypothetical protein
MYLINLKSACDRTTVHISSITSTGSEFTCVLQASIIEYHKGRVTKQCTKEQKVLRSHCEAIGLSSKRELIAATRTLEVGGERNVMAVAAVGLASPAAIDTDGEDSFLPRLLRTFCAKSATDRYTAYSFPASPKRVTNIMVMTSKRGTLLFTFDYGDHPNPSRKFLCVIKAL